MMVLGGVLGLVVGVALLLAVGAFLDHHMGLEENTRERSRLERERHILQLEVELGFRDPEEVRWSPAVHNHQRLVADMKERYEMRPRIETRPQARAYQLSDREVAQLLLRHKRGAA